MANKIIARVEKLEVKAAEDNVVLKGILDTLKKMDERMEGMDHVIRGNGRPGLVANMETTAVRLTSLESSRNKWRDLFFSVVGVVVGGLILFLIQQQWSKSNEPKSVSSVQQISRNH